MKRVLLVIMTLALSAGLYAQSSETLDELRLFVQTALIKAEQQSRAIGTDQIALGEILKDYSQPPLSILLGDLFTAEVTNRSTLSLTYGYDEGDFLVLEGVIHIIDDVVYMQLIIKNGFQSAPLAIIEKTMAYNTLSSLLTEDYYDDDDYYYDTPVLREDSLLEPNDRLEESRPIMIGESIELALTPGDKDWFTFRLEDDLFESDAYMVEISTSGDTDTYMTIYGPDDPDLFYGESDDYYDTNAGMVLTAEKAGTYWVVINGYSDEDNGYYSLDSYGETIEFADPYEPNNSWDNPTPVTWGEEQTHAFAFGDNKDVFAFELDSSSEVVFSTEGGLDTYMDLYDEDGEYITGDDDGGKDSNARIEIDLQRGLYFLEVSPYDNSNYGDYILFSNVE